MSRDLLTKPAKPHNVPEDGADGKKPQVERANRAASTSLALPQAQPPIPQGGGGGGRGGQGGGQFQGEETAAASTAGTAAAAPAAPAAAGATPAPAAVTPQPAYRSAYFTRDVSSVRQVNPGAKPQQALRGAPAATDLRRVTLPDGGEAAGMPDPARLHGTGTRMGLTDGLGVDLPGLLARQGSELQAEGMTAATIVAKQKLLEARVLQRQGVLQRLSTLAWSRRSATLQAALDSDRAAAAQDQDLAADGSALVRATEAGADGLHRALRRALGLKK